MIPHSKGHVLGKVMIPVRTWDLATWQAVPEWCPQFSSPVLSQTLNQGTLCARASLAHRGGERRVIWNFLYRFTLLLFHTIVGEGNMATHNAIIMAIMGIIAMPLNRGNVLPCQWEKKHAEEDIV